MNLLSERELRTLLDQLCVRLGFCLPPDEYERFVQDPPSTVDEFTAAVFVAEGLDPSGASPGLYRQVRALVGDAFRKSETVQSDGDSDG